MAGNRDLVEDGVNGLVVPPDRPRELAEAIVGLLGDRRLRQRLTAGAIETVSGCDVRGMAEATAAVYRELCGEPAAGSAEAREELRMRADALLP